MVFVVRDSDYCWENIEKLIFYDNSKIKSEDNNLN